MKKSSSKAATSPQTAWASNGLIGLVKGQKGFVDIGLSLCTKYWAGMLNC